MLLESFFLQCWYVLTANNNNNKNNRKAISVICCCFCFKPITIISINNHHHHHHHHHHLSNIILPHTLTNTTNVLMGKKGKTTESEKKWTEFPLISCDTYLMMGSSNWYLFTLTTTTTTNGFEDWNNTKKNQITLRNSNNN